MAQRDTFDQPPENMPRWNENQPPSARKLSALGKAIDRMVKGIRPPRQVDGFGINFSTIQQFEVSEIRDDFIIAFPFDGVSGETENPVNIAKPYLLRKDPFGIGGFSRDGISYVYSDAQNRTATREEDEEEQTIVPKYFKSDLIYAAKNISGGTTVINSETSDPPSPIDFLDINVDGRFWAVKSE